MTEVVLRQILDPQTTRVRGGVCVEVLSFFIPEEVNGKKFKKKKKNTSFKVSCRLSVPTCFVVH
jgi:hypothetical protein